MLNSCNNSIKPELALSENFGGSVQELESALQFQHTFPFTTAMLELVMRLHIHKT
jgi:hypothetical protein